MKQRESRDSLETTEDKTRRRSKSRPRSRRSLSADTSSKSSEERCSARKILSISSMADLSPASHRYIKDRDSSKETVQHPAKDGHRSSSRDRVQHPGRYRSSSKERVQHPDRYRSLSSDRVQHPGSYRSSSRDRVQHPDRYRSSSRDRYRSSSRDRVQHPDRYRSSSRDRYRSSSRDRVHHPGRYRSLSRDRVQSPGRYRSSSRDRVQHHRRYRSSSRHRVLRRDKDKGFSAEPPGDHLPPLSKSAIPVDLSLSPDSQNYITNQQNKQRIQELLSKCEKSMSIERQANAIDKMEREQQKTKDKQVRRENLLKAQMPKNRGIEETPKETRTVKCDMSSTRSNDAVKGAVLAAQRSRVQSSSSKSLKKHVVTPLKVTPHISSQQRRRDSPGQKSAKRNSYDDRKRQRLSSNRSLRRSSSASSSSDSSSSGLRHTSAIRYQQPLDKRHGQPSQSGRKHRRKVSSQSYSSSSSSRSSSCSSSSSRSSSSAYRQTREASHRKPDTRSRQSGLSTRGRGVGTSLSSSKADRTHHESSRKPISSPTITSTDRTRRPVTGGKKGLKRKRQTSDESSDDEEQVRKKDVNKRQAEERRKAVATKSKQTSSTTTKQMSTVDIKQKPAITTQPKATAAVTAACGTVKGNEAGSKQATGKPKETLDEMETFLKMLKQKKKENV